MNAVNLTESIKEKALEIGFDLIGISPVGRFPENQFYKQWLARGFAGEMKYLEKEPEKRQDVKKILPEAKSVISCGLNYNTAYPYSTEETDMNKGWVARYAWGDDYHDVINDKLRRLLDFIKEIAPQEVKAKIYVDTGPVLDRVYGKYAGIGWIGKNTCVINQEIGSWIFIGEIITDLELEYDTPVPDRCGTCRRCIDACPTDALREPYVLDSRLCISYLTIELKKDIPFELRDKIKNNIFGCDICQDVCPWNRRAETTEESRFQPREGVYNPELSEFAKLTDEDFKIVFKGSPVKRAKRKGLLRNIMVAIGNSGMPELAPHAEKSLHDKDPLIRTHAAWALWKLRGEGSYEALSNRMSVEDNPAVREEISFILEQHAGCRIHDT